MKAILFIFLFVFMYNASKAQTSVQSAKDTTKIIRICAPSRSSMLAPKPLVIVFTHRQPNGIIMDVDSMSKINPKFIKSINVLKDSTATSKYGNAAKGGVIQIYLDDDKYPDADKLLLKKDTIKSIKP
jgi:hypothetical protein